MLGLGLDELGWMGACTEHFQNTTCGGIQVKCWHQNSSRLVGKDGGDRVLRYGLIMIREI